MLNDPGRCSIGGKWVRHSTHSFQSHAFCVTCICWSTSFVQCREGGGGGGQTRLAGSEQGRKGEDGKAERKPARAIRRTVTRPVWGVGQQ